MTANGLVYQPIVIDARPINSGYYLKAHMGEDGGVVFTYSQWIVSFDRNGAFRGKFEAPGPINSAAVNRLGAVFFTTVGRTEDEDRAYLTDHFLTPRAPFQPMMVDPQSVDLAPRPIPFKPTGFFAKPWGNGFLVKVWKTSASTAADGRLDWLVYVDNAGRFDPYPSHVPLADRSPNAVNDTGSNGIDVIPLPGPTPVGVMRSCGLSDCVNSSLIHNHFGFL
jgi:hypothetical protein